ncbi:MAG: toxin-activating lysine-acyltransferase [Roseobacter sp.]
MTATEKSKPFQPSLPTSEEFSRSLGHVTWLMTQSPHHKKRQIELIEAHVIAPLMFKQVRVYLNGKQPLAAVIWASVSDVVKEKLEAGGYIMQLQDWRSGPEVVVVDCVSPLGDPKVFTEKFIAQVEAAQQTKT